MIKQYTIMDFIVSPYAVMNKTSSDIDRRHKIDIGWACEVDLRSMHVSVDNSPMSAMKTIMA